MSKFNYFTIAALPRLTWDSDLPGTLAQMLEDFELQFDDLKEGIRDILLLNDIRNLELAVKAKADGNEKSPDFYGAGTAEPEALMHFLDDPIHNAPDFCPDFMADFFADYKTAEERQEHFEELYLAYFQYLQENNDEYIRYYGRFETTVRTILAAIRLNKSDKNLDKYLKGDPDAVKIILENRNNADLGLKNYFPEVSDIAALFDGTKDPVEIEKELDKIRFRLLDDMGGDKPFADHVIYAFVIGLLIRDRWNTQNDEKGMAILDNIIKGNF